MKLHDTLIKQAKYVLTDVVENNCVGYWAEILDLSRDKEGYVNKIQVRENYDGEIGKCKTIYPSHVLDGRLKLLTGEVEVSRDIAAQFVGKEWHTDMNGDDCVIQAIMFNVIVYG